jgi:hypothetical protein
LESGAIVKVIELADVQPTLNEIMGLAQEDIVVLREPGGAVYAVSQVDEFDLEVELLRNQPDFMAFLRELSGHKSAISLQDLRKELLA